MINKIAIFISRYGTTAQNLIAATQDGRLDAKVMFLGSHRYTTCEQAPVLWVYAIDHDLLFQMARRMGVKLVILAGWNKLLKVPDDFRGKVVNIHPSLLPKYGGKGMMSLAVHQAVLDNGETESGCTVHWVDDEYDHGPIIAQRTVAVLENDTAETLMERVKAEERKLLPEVLQELLGS